MPVSSIARHVSRAKAERLVASGRMIACTIALLAASIGFATNRSEPHALFLIGAWWIVATAVYLHTRRRAHPRTSPYLLVFDLLVISILLMTTGGVTSVFFPMIVMPPFAANLLFGRRVIVWAASGGILVYVSTLLVTHAMNDPRLMIMRFGVVVLLGAAVIQRDVYEERVHRDLDQLATWPRTLSADRTAAVRDLLSHAAVALRVSRAAAAWEEPDGSEYFAHLDGGEFELDEESPDGFVAPELGPATAFLAPGLRSIDDVIETWSGPAVSPRLAERLGPASILGARFASQTVKGWLFLLDVPDASADDVVLAEIVARLVSAGLDQVNLTEMLSERVTTDERIRLSRDLHDGLLQSLGGLAMHAEGARRAIDSDPRGAAERLRLVVEQLVEAQRTLRDFVDDLRPGLVARREPLDVRLHRVARSIERQWGIPVELDTRADLLNAAQANDVVALVTEAATNAAKHAGATKIRGSVRIDGASVRVEVEDDGHGFPFRGRYELPELIGDRRGPWSLRERVAALGGSLAIESTPHGARVELTLPRM